MKLLTPLKTVILQIAEHKTLFGLSSTFALCWEFLLKRWELDVIMLPSIIILVAVNTWSGVRKAKFENNFSKTILREKTQNKCIGYALWLICMYTLSFMVLVSVVGKITVFPVDWLHFPISATYLFIAGVEILSTSSNLKDTGVRTPTFITSKLEDFVDTGKMNPLTENKP